MGTDDDADETRATEDGYKGRSVWGSTEVETKAPGEEQSQCDDSSAEPEKASDGGGGIGLDRCCRGHGVRVGDGDGTRVWIGLWIRSRNDNGGRELRKGGEEVGVGVGML